ncbi:hypothetical protein [Pectobacterium aroidearum]|uniref:hypothetical protein n=1 Tax=Pectobacterium aroidearum TaxID=1201031 RepID=UPI0031597155
MSQDLRALRRVLTSGFGWTVMPVYLCQDLLDAGKLAIIPHPSVLHNWITIWPGCRARCASRV